MTQALNLEPRPETPTVGSGFRLRVYHSFGRQMWGWCPCSGIRWSRGGLTNDRAGPKVLRTMLFLYPKFLHRSTALSIDILISFG